MFTSQNSIIWFTIKHRIVQNNVSYIPKLDIKKAAPQAALQYSITTAPGVPVAHEGYRLVLLPLSPDTIHRPPLHRPENCHDPILQYKYYT